jgi:hypothetical protein
MSTDREINPKPGTGNKRAARVTRGSRNPKHGKRKHYIVHKPKQIKVKKLWTRCNVMCNNKSSRKRAKVKNACASHHIKHHGTHVHPTAAKPGIKKLAVTRCG